MLIYYDEDGKKMKGIYEGHPDQKYGHTTYSQHGEDLLILNLFTELGISKPSYLDLGAHDPIVISNTKLLYDRGSRGVNVEANPNLIENFYKQRPDDLNLNYGVTFLSEDIEADFLMYDSTSGRNTFDPVEVDRVNKSEQRFIIETKKILCKPLNTIVRDFCDGVFPDFLNCDIEGLDYDVLKSANFDDYFPPKIICVETRDRWKMHNMLVSKGFWLVFAMGENMIFMQDDLKFSGDCCLGKRK